MKILKPNSVSKLVERFDNELKNILMDDLKAIRFAKEQLLNSIKQGMEPDTLSVA
jgi:ubiquinone biosynthesis protein COQ9